MYSTVLAYNPYEDLNTNYRMKKVYSLKDIRYYLIFFLMKISPIQRTLTQIASTQLFTMRFCIKFQNKTFISSTPQ